MKLSFIFVVLCSMTMNVGTQVSITPETNTTIEGVNYVPGRLIVTFNKGIELSEISKFAEQNNIIDYNELTDRYEADSYREKEPIFLFHLNEKDYEKMCEKRELLLKSDMVFCVDFDHKHELESYPNDSDITYQWAIDKINLSGAWDIETGNSQTKVGIVEPDAIHGYHSELYDHISTSLSYDFINGCAYNLSNANSTHSTMIAGIIGAKTNNAYGIAGVCHDVTLVCYVASVDSNLISALTTASQNNVKILNCSMGGYNIYCQSLETAIQNYNGLLICSAGSLGRDTDLSIYQHYPSGYNSSNIISVGGSTQSDTVDFYNSDYGQTTVDVFAPGNNIYSTIPTNSFGSESGSSYAAPYVTGICALLLSKYPCASMSKIKDAVLNNVDIISSLSSYCVTGGRVNAYKTLYYSAPHAYDDYYSQYNSVMHIAYCSCGVSTLQSHNLGSMYMSGGMYYRNCLQCGYTKLVGGINSNEWPTE